MVRCFLRRFGDDRHIEAPADYLSNFPERNTLIGNAVISSPGGTLFKRQPVELGGIEPMHRRPAIEPVTHVCRNAFFSRDGDKTWNEAVIAVSMYRRRKAHRRHAHAL